ncbi:S41 family peptidase [Lentibacillus halophilus]|uniref:S41 family peptidase n=1 Tax=Lentibacillus halophilus TaxID=295065 RepID=A0ABN0ZGZ0_9BACI
MKLQKQHIVILLFAALILAFAGGFTGVKLAQSGPEPAEDEADGQTNQDNGKSPKQMEKVSRAYDIIQENYLQDVKDKQLIDGAIKGMLSSLDDPYSSYLDEEMMKKFNQQIESSFEGIGAEVSMVDGKVTIVSPIKDSPAEEAGLRPNDQILSVNGESVSGLNLQEAVQKIRGKKGTEVVIEVQRDGVSEPFDVTMERDDIPVETVYSNVKTIDGKKTGIMEITSFSDKTSDHFSKQLKKLENKGIDGLVIDVRGNPGGILTEVEDILKNFIPKDTPYVQIENSNGKISKSYSNLDEKKPYPISVLINQGSASASEILAVAMKETGYDVVGTKSFGKGTVQRALSLGDGSRVKLTLAKWLSPNGTWIHEKGVKPTVKVKQPPYYFTNPVELKEPLTFNDTGDDVKTIQTMLNGLGYEPGRTDGYFNHDTEAAVKAFQMDQDMEVTGKVTDKTAGLLETKLVKHIRSGDDDKQMDKALNVLY